MATAVKLGDAVEYVSKGKTKFAFVIGTRKTIKKDTSVQRPDKGNVNVFVISPQGQAYARFNVPVGADTGAEKFIQPVGATQAPAEETPEAPEDSAEVPA